MTTRPRPCSFWMRRAFERISGIVMLGESSMTIGALMTRGIVRLMASQSNLLTDPPRMWEMLTLASAESRRIAISAAVISNEKIALGVSPLMEAARTKSRPIVDLPTPGRAATTTI